MTSKLKFTMLVMFASTVLMSNAMAAATMAERDPAPLPTTVPGTAPTTAVPIVTLPQPQILIDGQEIASDLQLPPSEFDRSVIVRNFQGVGNIQFLLEASLGVGCCSNVTSLTFENCVFDRLPTEWGGEGSFSFLTVFSSLEQLNILNCNLTDIDLQAVLYNLGGYTERELNFSGNRLGENLSLLTSLLDDNFRGNKFALAALNLSNNSALGGVALGPYSNITELTR